MSPFAPLWLIAGREFRAYVATTSFWVALAVGPLLMAAVVLFSGPKEAPSPVAVTVTAATPADAAALFSALQEAGRIEGVSFVRLAGAHAVVTHDGTKVAFGALPQLSPSGRALVVRTLERDAAERLALRPGPPRLSVEAEPPPARSGEATARLILVVMLWMTLTGSLGMLLQAVVRERSNRALESLLASARPWQIAYGKLLGVGAVSGLILTAWLGSTSVLAALSPHSGQIVEGLASVFTRPALLAEAVVAYGLAFAFFGLLTIAIGARAADSAAAQNYARPLFTLLLIAFGVAMTSTAGASWLVLLPPLTPFLILLKSSPSLVEFVALGLLAIAAAASGAIASISFESAITPATSRSVAVHKNFSRAFFSFIEKHYHSFSRISS